MNDEAREQYEEELAERDRIGEKSPAADAAFGGRQEAEQIDWRMTAHWQFVPLGCTATLDDGRQVEGPTMLVSEPTIERRP